MVVQNTIHTIAIVLLLSSCISQSFGEVESPTDTVESKGINISGTEDASPLASTQTELKHGIAPGDGFNTNANGKTSEKDESLKSSVEEKTVDIEQGDDGKTKEVKDSGEKEVKDSGGKEDDKKGDGDENVDGKDKDTAGEKKEEKVEEVGIDLKVLNDNDFEHLTQAATGATTGDWLVLFTKEDNCEKCMEYEKELKIVYERVKHKLNVAKVVDGRSSKMTFKRFDIEDLPVISYFHHGKRFSYEGNATVENFMKFLEGDYELASWSNVRKPFSLFEYYLDESIEELNQMLRYKKNVSLIIFLAGLLSGVSLTTICGSVMFHLLENFKDEDETALCEQENSRDVAAGKNKDD